MKLEINKASNFSKRPTFLPNYMFICQQCAYKMNPIIEVISAMSVQHKKS